MITKIALAAALLSALLASTGASAADASNGAATMQPDSLKQAYAGDFLVGTAVNEAIVSGTDARAVPSWRSSSTPSPRKT